jgi:hypothetical protein
MWNDFRDCDFVHDNRLRNFEIKRIGNVVYFGSCSWVDLQAHRAKRKVIAAIRADFVALRIELGLPT